MSFTLDGREIETTEGGYLVNLEDWSPELASLIARGTTRSSLAPSRSLIY